MLCEKLATPRFWTDAKEPEAEEPSMMLNEVPAIGRLPVERTLRAPPTDTAPETVSRPALGVPDGLLTVSLNVPPVCV